MCRFLVSSSQLEKLKLEAKEKGYLNLSQFFRDQVLNRNQFLEFKIIETNQLIKKILEVLRDGRK